MPNENNENEKESTDHRQKLHRYVSERRTVLSYKASDRTNHTLHVFARVPRGQSKPHSE